MSAWKDSTEIVTLGEDVKVVGLSLRQSGLPLAFDSMGPLWERYGETCRGRMENAASPAVEYGVCLNTVPDYVTGCAVTAYGNIGEGFLACAVPAGRYIKDTFGAETFEGMVGGALMKRDVPAWAKAHGIEIDGSLLVEVYPTHAYREGCYEMYTLTPIK